VGTVNLRMIGLIFSVFLPFVTVCQAQEPVYDREVQAAIKHLTSEPSDDGFDVFEVFYKNPELATKILIAELKPIARGRYQSGKHPESVWVLRALRSLTGVDFRAVTTASLSSDESHFLDLNAKGEVTFFGTWMSRDSVWVAPKDAQVAIIKKWQEWYAAHGRTHTYVNDRNFDHWYF